MTHPPADPPFDPTAQPHVNPPFPAPAAPRLDATAEPLFTAPAPAEDEIVPCHAIRRPATAHEAVRSLDLHWIRGEGPLDQVVICSRVRVARNLRGHRFPSVAAPDDLHAIRAKTSLAVGASPFFRDFFDIELSTLSAAEMHTLVEKHLLSPLLSNLVGQGAPARAVVLGPYGVLGLMVNEEDHLRLQCLLPGLNLEAAWTQVSAMDDALENDLDFAFDPHLGYMTTCPSNVGTGMRASVMLHLPALALMNALDTIKSQIAGQVGLAVRGLYGEGSGIQGNLLQISNQISLGPSEEDLVAKVRGITERIVEQEHNARQRLRREFSAQLGDKVWRALGILRHAQVMNAAEALELLSMVRLGAELEILPPISRARLNELLVSIRPATLHILTGTHSDPLQADMTRARRIRQELSEEA